MNTKRITIFIGLFFLIESVFSQTKDYSIKVLNLHLKNTCSTFEKCDDITLSNSYLWYRLCNNLTHRIPIKKVYIKTIDEKNIALSETVYYVEIGCLNENSCITETGSKFNAPSIALRFAFSNTIDQHKALKMFNHLKQIVKKEKDSFD